MILSASVPSIVCTKNYVQALTLRACMQVQGAGVKLLPRYALRACYGRDNKRCGCWQPLTRAPTSKRRTQQMLPQCSAHGCDADAGAAELVTAVQAAGCDALCIMQCPVKLAKQRKAAARVQQQAQRARKDATGRIVKARGTRNACATSGNGGQFGKGRAGRHYIDVLLLHGSNAVAAELNDAHHDSVPATKVDLVRKAAAKCMGIKHVTFIQVKGADWHAEAAKLVAKLTK